MSLLQRKAGIATALATSLTKNLSRPGAAEAILQAYNITSSSSDDEALESIYNLVTDICYNAPALTFAEHFSGKTFYYQFDKPNPWNGLLKGKATHMLDAAFLFQNYNDKLEEGDKQVATSLANDFLKFVNGVAPWQEYEKGTGATKSFGASDDAVVALLERNGWDDGRRDTLFRLQEEAKIDLDEVSAAWDLFVAGQ